MNDQDTIFPDFPPPSGAMLTPSLTPDGWLAANGIKGRIGIDGEWGEVASLFEIQLGQPWTGVRRAPPQIQSVAFLSALSVKKNLAERAELKMKLDAAWLLPGGEGADAASAVLSNLFDDKKMVMAIDRRGSRHAYENTAAIGIFGWGGGSLAWGGRPLKEPLRCSAMPWLKAVDRTLFYSLNNVGRFAFHVEGSGAVAHFMAERAVSIPLATPMIDEAMEALQAHLENNRPGALGTI